MGIPIPQPQPKTKRYTMFINSPPNAPTGACVGRPAVRPRRDTEHQILIAKYGEAKANAVWKMQQAYHRIDKEREEKQIKVVDYIKPQITAPTRPKSKSIHVCRCKATTMTGRQCPFKASHGDFCKKHKL
jgi:hypothetical protein